MTNKHTTTTVKKRIIVSTAAQVGSQIFIALIGIVILKIMTNSLGIKGYGLYATIFAFVSTFALLTDLGLNAVTARDIAKNPDQADEIISHNMGLRLFMCTFMIPVIFGLSFIFYRHFDADLHIGILLLSLYLFFDAIRSVTMAYFASKVRNEVTAIINALQQIFLFGMVICVAVKHLGLYGFIAAFLLSNLIASTLTIRIARREVHVRPRMNIMIWKKILATSISLGLIQLINMMYLKADSIIISTIKGSAEVGIYAIAYSLILSFLTLPSFIMSALIPSMATADDKAIKAIVEKALQYMAILASLLAVGCFAIRNDIVPLVSSTAFASAGVPFAILGLASAFTYINSVFGFASVALNKHKKMVYVSAASLILNVVLNIILVPKYSVRGAAWATTISELIALCSSYYVFSRETKIKIPVIKFVVKPATAAVLTFITLHFFQKIYSSTTYFVNLVVESLFVVVIFALGLFALKAIPSEITDRVKSSINN